MIQIKKEDIGKHFVRCMNRGGIDVIIIVIISVLEMRRLKLREVLGLESRSEILSPGSFFSLNALVVTKAWCREKLGLVMEGLVPVCLIWTHVCSFTSAGTQSKSDAGKCSKNKNLLMGLMFQRDKWWYLILVSFFAFKRIS